MNTSSTVWVLCNHFGVESVLLSTLLAKEKQVEFFATEREARVADVQRFEADVERYQKYADSARSSAEDARLRLLTLDARQ